MTPTQYSRRLERRLIQEFRRTFYEKTGKHLVLNVESPTEKPSWLPHLSLSTLNTHLCGFIRDPRIKNKTLAQRCRVKELIFLRMVFVKLARMMHYTTLEIGLFLGQDHSTVINAIRREQKIRSIGYEDFLSLHDEIMMYLKNHYDEPVTAAPYTGEKRFDAEPVGVAVLP